jgi:hypothetical protein
MGRWGLTYYDFRNDTPDTATALTDYWFRASTTDGSTWGASQRVTPNSFDMKKAPVARGFFVGDYEGLDHGGNACKVFFAQANAGDRNPTDVFGATATP